VPKIEIKPEKFWDVAHSI